MSFRDEVNRATGRAREERAETRRREAAGREQTRHRQQYEQAGRARFAGLCSEAGKVLGQRLPARPVVFATSTRWALGEPRMVLLGRGWLLPAGFAGYGQPAVPDWTLLTSGALLGRPSLPIQAPRRRFGRSKYDPAVKNSRHRATWPHSSLGTSPGDQCLSLWEGGVHEAPGTAPSEVCKRHSVEVRFDGAIPLLLSYIEEAGYDGFDEDIYAPAEGVLASRVGRALAFPGASG